MKDLPELRVEDLVKAVPGMSSNTVGSYQVRYEQSYNQLALCTYLYPFFFEEDTHNTASLNGLYNFVEFNLDLHSAITEVELATMLFNTFYNSPHIIVTKNCIRSTATYRDESFEECRIRSIWELADFIGKDISWGHGKLSTFPTSKHYRGNQHKTAEPDGQLVIALS